MDDSTYTFMLIEVSKQGSQGRGRRDFRVPPRTGEFIVATDEEGNGRAYEVVAVIHPLAPSATSCGDLIIRYSASETNLRRSFVEP